MEDFTLRPDPDSDDQPGAWFLLAGEPRLVVQVDPGIGKHGVTSATGN